MRSVELSRLVLQHASQRYRYLYQNLLYVCSEQYVLLLFYSLSFIIVK